MEKGSVVYKRRPKKSPTRPSRSSVVHNDPEGVALAENDPDPITPARKDGKSWVDGSLSNRGRRSSMSSGEEFNLLSMAYKWAETLFERKDKNQQNGVGGIFRDRANKKPSVVNRSKKVNPSLEFVIEKQAMFIEIDAFELESEEESPATKPRPQGWFQLDVSKELEHSIPRKSALEIVPEDELEGFALDNLSAVLRTPHSGPLRNRTRGVSQFPSPSEDHSYNATQTNLLNSEDHRSPRLSFTAEARPTDHRNLVPDTHNRLSNSETRRLSFNGEATGSSGHRKSISEPLDQPAWEIKSEEGGQLTPSSEQRFSVECDLSAGIQRLQIGVDGGVHSLNALVEEDEEEISEVNENEGIKEKDLFRQSGEIHLATRQEDLLPIFEALLEECHQTRSLSLGEAIGDFCDLSKIVKLGEGTFGEAFKGGGCVFKIVPMDGDLLVNGEVQKTSAEMYSEVLLTKTLDRLRSVDCQEAAKPTNFCTNFIETKAIRICQGRYEVQLCRAWEEWDAMRASDNDHPMLFRQNQLYVVFVLADGGKDLETFVLSDFSEARSVLLQVVLALGVAEEGCGFEHRDLHWGNIVLARDQQHQYGHYRLLNEDLKMRTFGLSVSVIDFTLSRIDTGKHVFFCNLSADPALFEGPSDIQSDTYRRMLNLTKGNWEGRFPQTNCHWIHYLADILLKKKAFRCSSQEKRALRSFCKRVLLYESARAAVLDDFFNDMWIKPHQCHASVLSVKH